MNFKKKLYTGPNDSKSQENNTVGTYAAALQDHLLRNVNLYLPNKNNVKLLPTKQVSIHKVLTKNGRVINLDHNKLYENASKHPINKKDQQKSVLKDIESALKKSEANEQKNIQNKLYTYIKKLTLAQRLGLVEKPPKPLSNDEWVQVEEMNKKREDHSSCPICLEGFKTPNNQIILSCSHVFHKTCLANFEKFSKSRVCPICRRQDYEKKNFDQGFITYLTAQVIKVQKMVRGFVTRRKLYSKLQKTYKATSTLFKRRLLGFKLQLLNEKMTKKVRTRQKETEKLFVEIDKNLDDKNDFSLKLLEIQNIQRQTRENIQAVIPNIVQKNSLVEIPSIDSTKKGTELSDKWKEIHKVAVLRSENNCAICFNDLNNGKKLYLLNCTHLFHCACLVSFEYYSIFTQHSCPVCRSDYEKIEIDHW